jgi:spore maturation protein CgeB
VFFEHDVPYYRDARDLTELERGELVLYSSWEDVRERARTELEDADAAFVTSYCPDGVAATALVCESARPRRVFYDLDTPVTLTAFRAGERPFYIGERGLSDFDLVLSFTGGPALDALRDELGAPRVVPLYGHVDPSVHRPVAAQPRFAASLSYLGTYAADRQAGVQELFFAPARKATQHSFCLGGSMYPEPDQFPKNVRYLPHVAPAEHAAFFASSRLTLNITRQTMARFGYCPSGRLFEAAASGVPIVSDWFEGLDQFFDPGSEIFAAKDCCDVLSILDSSDAELRRRAAAARARVFDRHLAQHRAAELEGLLGLVPPRARSAPPSLRMEA